MTDWKVYESLERVVTFDANRIGPGLDTLRVVANVSPDTNYPECRIAILVRKLCELVLTVEQSQQLRDLLARAEADVSDALDPPAPPPVAATGTEGRCDSCSQPIQLAELVSAYDDATLHTEPCPGTEDRRG